MKCLLAPWDLSSLSPDEIIEELRTIAHTSINGISFSELGTAFGHTAKSYTAMGSYLPFLYFPKGSECVDCIGFAGFSKQMDGSVSFNNPDKKYAYLVHIYIKDFNKAKEVYDKAIEIYKSKLDASETPMSYASIYELSGSTGKEYLLLFVLNDMVF